MCDTVSLGSEEAQINDQGETSMQETIKERTLQPGKERNERNIGSIYGYIEKQG